MEPSNRDSILVLGNVGFRLRYSKDPDLRLSEFATRADVRLVRERIPEVRGIGPAALHMIDVWLHEEGARH